MTVLSIDEMAYKSKLLKTAPKAKMLFGAVPLVLCIVFSTNIVSLLTITLVGGATIFMGGVPPRRYFNMLMWPLGFLTLGTITIIFAGCDPNDALFSVPLFGGVYGITPYSLEFGATIMLKAIGAVSCLYFIALNTPMTDILEALRTMKVPVLIVSLMELIYRYIFVLLDEARRMRAAQDSRLGYVNISVSIKSVGQLIGQLFLRAYMRTDNVYNALRARGYDGEFRTVARSYAPSKCIYAGCAAMALVLLTAGILFKI